MGAIVDYLIAGVVSTLLAIHREIPEMIPAQGAYYKNYGGLDTSLFLMGHLTFGSLVAILYGYFTGGSGATF